MFWTKKEKNIRIPRVLLIPQEYELEIRELCDRYSSVPDGQSRVARYKLWSAVRLIFPEVSEGGWSIDCAQPLQTKIIEVIDWE